MTRAACGSEVDFAGFKRQWPVEHHFNRAAFGEYGVRTAGQQYAGETRRRSGRATDTGSQPGVSRSSPGDGADAGAAGTAFSDCAGIAALIRIALNHAFLLVQTFIASGIDGAQTGTKITRNSVGEGDRVKADVEFAPAFDAARPLHVRHGSGDVTARRYDDMAFNHDRKDGFEIDAIAWRGMFGTDAVDQAERDVRARLNRIGGSGRR